MKTLLIFFGIVTGITATAQQQTFDITNYTAPKGWNKQATESTVQFTNEDAAKGGYCIIMLFKSLPGSAKSKENFDAAWETVVKEMVKVSTAPEMQPVANENGWEAQSGFAPFESDGTKGVALLTTTTGFGKMVNILILTNSDVYEKEMNGFLESVSFNKLAGNNSIPMQQPVNKPAANNDYAFNTTNFDDGWVSTVQEDYILVKKKNIKVYLSFIERFDESQYSGTGLEKRNHYWDTYVSKFFFTGQKKLSNGGALTDYSADFIEGWATDKITGEKRYIAMILNIIAYTGTLSVIIASAPDEQQLKQQFPKADLKFNNDLLPMYSYNKFAVGKNDLVGKWSNSGGGTMNWYSTTTGQNVGATGAVTADVFQFNTNNTYTSEHKGATGWVGSMNTYQQKYNGAYTVSNWQVVATKRWDGKTETFDAWFEVIKGGRILKLKNKGMEYSLVKVK